MTYDIERIKSFVSDYQTTLRKISNERISSIKKTTSAFAVKRKELHEIIRQETPYYNVFEVLKIRHYEARVHTPFLRNLLDPKASHNQGTLFFNSFLLNVLSMPANAESLTNIKVLAERRNPFGQIDIEIWFESEGKQKAIVIENKVYHHDGEQQLFRYYKYLTEYRKMKIEDIILVYLTLGGTDPHKDSLVDTPKECLKLISYRNDITSWLSTCGEQIGANSLSFTINQYLKTIKIL